MRRFWVIAVAVLAIGAGAVAAYAAVGQSTGNAAKAPPAHHPKRPLHIRRWMLASHTRSRMRPPHGWGHRLSPVPVLSDGAHGGAVLRLQQLLAWEGYLPLAFHATGPAPLYPYAPRPGRFTVRYPSLPGLASQWASGMFGPMTKGAVMTFQSQHGLPVDGVAGPQVWRGLQRSLSKPNPKGYTYVVVHETLPETITIYRNGQSVFSSPANTGIAQAPTALGTYPVYLRYTSTTMSGTNPDGSHYSDPGVPWVSYFNGGDAVHGFLRGSYGSPQSLGCVELPYSAAAQAYQLMDYGTLVTVTS
ncbi:MAG: L,D-transpeptidase family protein [Gaiellales bacterium]